MISTALGDVGISTGYYGNNPFGMGRLEKPGNWTEFHQPNKEGKGIDCTVLIDEMLNFGREQHDAGKRFFISSLPYEPHTPYRYHEGISERYHGGSWGPPVGKSVDGYLLNDIVNGKKTLNDDQWAQLRALYNGEVEHMDQCFGQLVDGLKKSGLADETAVVLTSDHGEGMFEHGRMGHAFGHYSELANVPLVLFADGFVDEGPRKIQTVTNHIDIAPTVLDLMGAEPPDEIQGQSLLPMALRQGPWTPRVVSLEYGRSYALRSLRWKLIVDYGGQESLYDEQSDPTEQKDLIDDNDFALRYMRDLAGFFLEHRKQWHTSRWGTLGNHSAEFVEAVSDNDR
jgi:arylsulfatase A-like enzyme